MFHLIHSFNYFSNAVCTIYTSIFCVTKEMCIITASTQISDGNLFFIHHMKNSDVTLLHYIQEIFSSKWKIAKGRTLYTQGWTYIQVNTVWNKLHWWSQHSYSKLNHYTVGCITKEVGLDWQDILDFFDTSFRPALGSLLASNQLVQYNYDSAWGNTAKMWSQPFGCVCYN
jgi:hypothetical protein